VGVARKFARFGNFAGMYLRNGESVIGQTHGVDSGPRCVQTDDGSFAPVAAFRHTSASNMARRETMSTRYG
jgi:hypothetical protein